MSTFPAAVLSSKLYEFEKQQSDIYVEKRLLTKRIEDMQAQVRSQRVDASALFHVCHTIVLLKCTHSCSVSHMCAPSSSTRTLFCSGTHVVVVVVPSPFLPLSICKRMCVLFTSLHPVQIDGRDRVDREIEQCVCSLMDKTKHMEELNKKLVAKINELEAAKATPDVDDETS